MMPQKKLLLATEGLAAQSSKFLRHQNKMQTFQTVKYKQGYKQWGTWSLENGRWKMEVKFVGEVEIPDH